MLEIYFEYYGITPHRKFISLLLHPRMHCFNVAEICFVFPERQIFIFRVVNVSPIFCKYLPLKKDLTLQLKFEVFQTKRLRCIRRISDEDPLKRTGSLFYQIPLKKGTGAG